MLFHLIISEPSTAKRAIWEHIFRETTNVVIVDAWLFTLKAQINLDATLMLQRHALEMLGGLPAPGESLILNSQGKSEMPPWIVTTPPFSAHFEEALHPDGYLTYEVVQDQKLTFKEETEIVFTKIFKAIIQFNENNSELPIRTFGIVPEYIAYNVTIERLKIYAEIIRETFLKHVNDLDSSLE